MRGMGSNKTGRQVGVTLLEVIVGLAIMGLIMVPLAGIINQFIFVPGQWSASVTMMNNTRAAVRWIAEDARQATTFTSSTDPEYGTFTWTDRTLFPIATHTARYFFSDSDGRLMREETVHGRSQTTLVTDHIQEYGDVSIQESDGVVRASVTSTADAIVSTMTRHVPITAEMRPESPAAQPTPPPLKLAWDDFETGDLTGGSGWMGDWAVTGDVTIQMDEAPHEGSFHMRLRDSTAYVDRSVDLSGQTGVRIQFWAKAADFEATDVIELKVSPDGATFTTVRSWVDGQDDAVYRFEDIDISSFSMTSEFFIAFDSGVDDLTDRLFIDDLRIVIIWSP